MKYLVTQQQSKDVRRFIIDVPESFKISYARVNPGSKVYDADNTWCLRIYETEKQQRALFRNVIEFRSLDLAIEEVPDGIEPGVKLANPAKQGVVEPLWLASKVAQASQVPQVVVAGAGNGAYVAAVDGDEPF